MCEKIIINIPLDQYDNIDIESAEKFASQGIDVFNIEDPFFNDICFPYESEYGTDVTLSDRVENYYQNVSFCDENCNYEGVNYTTNEAICSCNVQEDLLDNLLDNKLTGEVYEIVKSLNINVMKCYDSIFKFDNLIKNYGGWIMSGFLGGQIAMTVIFSRTGLNSIKEYILDFIKSNPPKKKKKEDNNLSNKNNTNESNSNKTNNKNNTNVNDIKIYKNINNESEVYSNSNNDDSKSKKLLLNFPHFEITISSENKLINDTKIKLNKTKIENEDKLTEINNGTEEPNFYINSLENEEDEISRNNILNLNNKIINEELDSSNELKKNEYFNSKIAKETFYKNEKTGLIEMIPEVGYIKNPILYDISEKPYTNKEKELKRKISIIENEKKKFIMIMN